VKGPLLPTDQVVLLSADGEPMHPPVAVADLDKRIVPHRAGTLTHVMVTRGDDVLYVLPIAREFDPGDSLDFRDLPTEWGNT